MNTNYPIGICEKMCPDEEIIRRQRQGLLHKLEILPRVNKSERPTANINCCVKEFCRSAAGQNTQDVKQLRTAEALLKTIDFLLHDVITLEHSPWNVIYDFIVDRLRAVRQDMIVQNLSRPNCISMLQPMVKFYVYSAYRLCGEPISKYDPVLNTNHLQECLNRLLRLYDEADVLFAKLTHFNSIATINNNMLYAQCRPFMESLYLIVNLGNTVAINRTINIPKIWKNRLVKTCLMISIAYWHGNYVRVCQNIYKLPPLLLACAVLHLSKIRKNALSTMSSAYNNKLLTYPTTNLQNLLLYESQDELLEDCSYYGIPVQNNEILFTKSLFLLQKRESPQHRYKFVDEILSKYNLPELLLEDEIY